MGHSRKIEDAFNRTMWRVIQSCRPVATCTVAHIGDFPVLTSLTSYNERMAVTYSATEAKAKFSEVIRRVRNGETVIVTYRGEPVAEIVPYKRPKPDDESDSDDGATKTTMEERYEELVRRGIVVPARNPRAPIRPEAHRPGGLKRFLEDRHR